MDQAKEDSTGAFLGWTMTIWGSVVDPAKAKLYDVPVLEGILPPLFDNSQDTGGDVSPPSATASTQYTKPTDHLPGDHGDAPGEADKPAFSSKPTTVPSSVEDVEEPGATGTPEPMSTPTPDEGWFSDLSNLLTNQAWFFIALGAVVLFGSAAGLFFWLRARRRRRQNYQSLPAGDDVPMGSIGGTGMRTKELYAAFDEEDDEADEATELKRGMSPRPEGLEFHDAFLDDDDPASAAAQQTRYKDEPEPREQAKTQERDAQRAGAGSPGGSSGSGSWEHASRDPST